MIRIMEPVRRAVLAALPLTAAMAACGGSASSAQPEPAAPTAHTAARPAIRITAPGPGRLIEAQSFGRRQLRAVIKVAGHAAPGQQLTLRGACGGTDCDGITFANASGVWRTRFEAISPPKKSTVQLTVAYADVKTGDKGATLGLRLHKGQIPEAAPQPTPPKRNGATTGGTAAPAGGHPYAGPRTMIVIGDSLAVGIANQLTSLLDTWDVAIDARTGRPLSEGMAILKETQLPSGEEGARTILAFSLGTNDGPQSVDLLDNAVRQSLARLGTHGCAIWATIARPPVNGVNYRAMNARLYELANDPQFNAQLLIVPWAEQYAKHRSWQYSDHVHATAEGYAARAQMYADAARSCAA